MSVFLLRLWGISKHREGKRNNVEVAFWHQNILLLLLRERERLFVDVMEVVVVSQQRKRMSTTKRSFIAAAAAEHKTETTIWQLFGN